MSLLTTPFSTKDLDQNEGAFDAGSARLTDSRGLQPRYIKSGDFFELRTNNAIARPLPSFKLLEMQWFLQRVVGMAGAAGPYDSDWDEDSDEEISNIGLNAVGDTSFVFTSTGPSLPASPQFLRKDNLHPTEGSKHHTEEAEGDRVGDRVGDRRSTSDYVVLRKYQVGRFRGFSGFVKLLLNVFREGTVMVICW